MYHFGLGFVTVAGSASCMVNSYAYQFKWRPGQLTTTVCMYQVWLLRTCKSGGIWHVL